MRKKIPTGTVYQRKYRNRQGKTRKTKTWFIKYYVHGKPVRIPAGTQDRDEALRILRQKMAKVARYVDYSEQIERVLVDQLLDLVVEDYRFNKRSTTYDVELRIGKHLRPFFGQRKARDVTTTVIKNYTDVRSRKEAEPATINKELAYLRRAFRLGYQHDPRLVDKVPYFRMLPVDNARSGVVDHEHYRAIRDSLPAYARIALVIAYHTGARKGEIRKIRLDKIDLKFGRIELPGKTTKNKKPRYLPIYGDMRAELSMAISLADPQCPFLVQRDGRPVYDWEKSWKTACELAQIDDALFHDLRRTALTNMIEAGFSEKEAMEISGHKTRHVFDRYHIVSPRRLKQLAERLEKYLHDKEQETLGTDSGHRQNAKIQ
ncbi:MAG TPA: site-specific integrase [Bryobacteraceae bacterium]|nr:site-specific integrase [Bryobacteraceae bacterium]